MTAFPETESRPERVNRALLWAGAVFFTIHFVLSWNYFDLRMLQQDAPFYVVKLVQQQKLVCEHYRFSTYLIQCIPYVVMKSGASLEMIAKSYSVATDVYYFFLFLFAVIFLRNNSGGLMLILFTALALGRDYFLPAAEYGYAIMTAAVLFGLQFDPAEKFPRIRLLLAGLVALIAINFHPVSVFALGFVIVYGYLGSEKQVRTTWIALGCITLVIFLLRLWLVPPDDYEHNKMKSWYEVSHFIFHPGALKSIGAVMGYFSGNFPQLRFLAIITPLLLLLRKRIIQAVFLLAFIYFSVILFGTIKGAGETEVWFGEYFILLGIPLLGPAVEILLAMKKRIVLLTTVVISSFVFLHQIPDMYTFYQRRLDYISRLIANGKKFPERKYIIDDRNFPGRLMINTWVLPFQTLVYSSFVHPDSALTCIVAPEVNAYDSLLKTPGYFLGPEWGIDMFDYDDNRLRKNYFNLPEKGYRKLTTSQAGSFPPDSLLKEDGVFLEPQENIVYATKDTLLFTSVKIINNTNEVIPAIPDHLSPTYVSYHMVDANGDMLAWDNIRTALEADIHGSMLTGMDISTGGLPKGTYWIKPSLITEGKRWWGTCDPVKLIVN